MSRRIALFVEGDTERTLPKFFSKWLAAQLPGTSRIGITAVKFQGVSDFLDEMPKKVELHLDGGRANVVVGLVDLYGIPKDRIDLSKHAAISQKVSAARQYIQSLVPTRFSKRFFQHFAVHEVEAWLLAYPDKWPAKVRSQITKRPPEEVNFNEPPAKFLKRVLGRKYKKTVAARKLFPTVDPQTAIDKCPYLKLLTDDLLRIAKRLQQ